MTLLNLLSHILPPLVRIDGCGLLGEAPCPRIIFFRYNRESTAMCFSHSPVVAKKNETEILEGNMLMSLGDKTQTTGGSVRSFLQVHNSIPCARQSHNTCSNMRLRFSMGPISPPLSPDGFEDVQFVKIDYFSQTTRRAEISSPRLKFSTSTQTPPLVATVSPKSQKDLRPVCLTQHPVPNT